MKENQYFLFSLSAENMESLQSSNYKKCEYTPFIYMKLLTGIKETNSKPRSKKKEKCKAHSTDE